MLVTLLEVAQLTVNDKKFYWGLLYPKQFIHMEESKELEALIGKKEARTIVFNIYNVPIEIKTWRLRKKVENVIPTDRILNFAKILILDHKSCYAIWEKYLDTLPAMYDSNWLFQSSPDSVYRNVFSVIYENWHESNYKHIDERLKSILEELSADMNRKVTVTGFRKWLKTSKFFYPRVVGDKYHINSELLRSLEEGQEVNLIQESFNDYDDFAVGVYLKNGKQLGYFRRPVARVLYKRLNKETFSARIHFIDAEGGNNNRIVVEVKFD